MQLPLTRIQAALLALLIPLAGAILAAVAALLCILLWPLLLYPLYLGLRRKKNVETEVVGV